MGTATNLAVVGTLVTATLTSCGGGAKDSAQSPQDGAAHSGAWLNFGQSAGGDFFSLPSEYKQVSKPLGVIVGSRILQQSRDEDVSYIRDRFGLSPLRLYSDGDFNSGMINAGPGRLPVVNIPDTDSERTALARNRHSKVDLRHSKFSVEENLARAIQDAAGGSLIAREIWMLDEAGSALVVMQSGRFELDGKLHILEFSAPGLASAQPDSARQLAWSRILEVMPEVIAGYSGFTVGK